MNKKGQVTIFIVLGLIMLISVGLFFFIKSSIVKKEIAPGVSMIVEELPSEFMSLKPFVEKCIESTAREGLIILGQRGGYVYTDKLNPADTATEGDSVRFSRSSDLVVPYWFYLSSPNNCIGKCGFASKEIPLKSSLSSDSVESQLSEYIEKNLAYCIDDFKSLKELGYDIKEDGSPKAKAVVTPNNMVIQLEYPLTISKQGSKSEINNFYTTLDLNLNNIYKMAEYLTYLESQYRFLEKNSMNLIVGFSGKNKKKLPPVSDSSFEIANTLKWRKSNVKLNIKTILMEYIPFLRLRDSLGWTEITTDSVLSDTIYNYGMALPNNISINNLEVNFNYFDFWDIYFDLNCNGEVCEPESAFTDLLPIGLQRYHFVYDLSFPALVEINDPSAFAGEGYSFSFMLESNLRNNKPMPASFNPVPPLAGDSTMLCDEDQKTSGNVEIAAIDSIDNSNISDADVFYSCIESCYIGQTKNGMLNTSLPVCRGGVLSLRKDGYETVFIRYDAALEKKDYIRAVMERKKSLNVAVKKKMLVKQGSQWVLSADQNLESYETAVVTLSRNSGQPGQNIIEIKNDAQDQISVTEGDYEIIANIISEKPYLIPSRKISAGDHDIEVPAFNTSSVVSGSSEFNYTFTKEDLSKNTMTLYILSVDLYSIPYGERSMDTFEIASKLPDYARRYYIELLPRFE